MYPLYMTSSAGNEQRYMYFWLCIRSSEDAPLSAVSKRPVMLKTGNLDSNKIVVHIHLI